MSLFGRKNTILVIYHKSDLDGLCCAAIAREAIGDGADYLGYEYDEPIPDLSVYHTVFILDISLPEAVMIENKGKIIWCDHHKSILEKLKDHKFEGLQIDGVAACRLSYQWFFPDANLLYPTKEDFVNLRVVEPYAVQLLGLYDIWDKRWPCVDTFQLGMQSEKNPPWSALLQTGLEKGDLVDAIIDKGEAIQSYMDTVNAQISVERGFDVAFEGLLFRALNTARCNSLTFSAAIRPEHDGVMGYYWNGKLWKFSLYGVLHKKDIDLSKIAVKYGGGGSCPSLWLRIKILARTIHKYLSNVSTQVKSHHPRPPLEDSNPPIKAGNCGRG
jgi:hypothetical protein